VSLSSVLGLGGTSWVVTVRVMVSVRSLNRNFVVVLVNSFLTPSIKSFKKSHIAYIAHIA